MARGFTGVFKDQRASEVGDIITVVVAIEDEAQLDNRTRHDRAASDDFDLGGLFGLVRQNQLFPPIIFLILALRWLMTAGVE